VEEVGRITRAAGVVSFFTLLSRLMGLLRDVVVGYLFGAQGVADAFFVAFRIPNLLRRLTAEGAITAGFIPVFTDYLANYGQNEAIRVARIIFTFAALFLGVLTLLGILFALPLIKLFAPGFSADLEKLRLTVFLTRLMFPYIFFISLVALTMGVLNSMRHFMAPALSPVLLNLSIVVSAVLLSPFLDEPVVSLGYGVLMGGVVQLLFQLPYLSRHGFSYAPDFHFRDPAMRRLLLLLGPTLFGAAVYQINVLASTMLASMLPEGSVSYLYYADRLLEFPVGIFAIALGTAALPSFSALAAKKEFVELRATLSYALQLMNFISLPATLGLVVMSVPVFSLLFQRGAFDADTTLRTAQALIYFSLGLWGISGTKLVVPVFYALQDTRTPVWVGLWSFILNLLLSLTLMGKATAGAESDALAQFVAQLSQYLGLYSFSYSGLALATSISSTFNFLTLLFVLQRRLGQFPLRGFFLSFCRNLFNALLMAVPLFLIVRSIDWVGSELTLLTRGVIFLLLPVVGILLYFGFSFLWGSSEWHFVREVGARLRRASPEDIL
jgi:putative peptidoglycan lipid II flippase